ncbi:DMT family transporter [Candidatus Babeliales bacterium]|nr:DMT family transporter [Candidatus Babeliales bacterium]
MILVVILYAILASTFIFAKEAVSYAKPCFLIGFRMIIAGSLLWGSQFFLNRKTAMPKREDWFLFFKTTVFHIYLAFVLEFWSLQYVSALKTTIIYSATPFIAALLSYFLLKERLSFKKLLGVMIGIGGLMPTLLAQASGSELSMELWRISLPEGVLMIAVVSATYAWFLVSQLMKKGYSFGLINGIAMFMGGIMSLATSAVFEGFSSPIKDFWPFMMWVFLLIITANIVFYNMYSWLLQRYSITFLSFSGFLCPCFGTLYDWLFMGGTLAWQTFASLGLITIGLYLFYQDELRSNRAKKGSIKPIPFE